MMVENHYTGLGFTPVEGAATAQFELNVTEYRNRVCYIKNKK